MVTCIRHKLCSDEKHPPFQGNEEYYVPNVSCIFEEILFKLEDVDHDVPIPVQCDGKVQDHSEYIEGYLNEEPKDSDDIIRSFHNTQTNSNALIKNDTSIDEQAICETSVPDTDTIVTESQEKLEESSLELKKAEEKMSGSADKSSESKALKPKSAKKDHPTCKLECFVCKKLYASETSLRNHINNIHDPSAKKHKCKFCGAAFFRAYLLKNHLDNQHYDIKKFICTTCGMGLKSKISLDRHMYRHSGVKPFKCSWNGCERTFTLTTNRDEHLRSHTGEKCFQCLVDGCDKRYIFAADLRTHKYRKHNIFTNKIPCPVCNEVFPQKAILKKHMLKKHDQVTVNN